MELHTLVATPCALPSMPRIVALLLAELAQPQPQLQRLNQLFGGDPALAARLLEQANGALFRATGEVVGVPEALALLSQAQLHSLVRSAPLGAASRSVPGVNLPQFWRYSHNTARLARALAGFVQHNQLAAYTAGLLHGVGELVLHLGYAEKAQSLNTLVPPLDYRRAKIEQRILGYHYAQISAGLAQRWQLPSSVVDALTYMVAPLDNQVYEPLAGVLHLAAWRARAREAGWGEKELAVSFPGEVGLALGMDIDMVLQQDPIDWHSRPEAGDWV